MFKPKKSNTCKTYLIEPAYPSYLLVFLNTEKHLVSLMDYNFHNFISLKATTDRSFKIYDNLLFIKKIYTPVTHSGKAIKGALYTNRNEVKYR